MKWKTHSDALPLKREYEIREGAAADAVRKICAALGASVSTQYKVAGVVAEQLEKDSESERRKP